MISCNKEVGDRGKMWTELQKPGCVDIASAIARDHLEYSSRAVPATWASNDRRTGCKLLLHSPDISF